MPSLLQDEAEGYECQRLSKWFASRLDAREVVRRFHRESPNDESYTTACIKCKVRVYSAYALEKDTVSSAI